MEPLCLCHSRCKRGGSETAKPSYRKFLEIRTHQKEQHCINEADLLKEFTHFLPAEITPATALAEMKVGSKRSRRIYYGTRSPNEALRYVASFLSAPSKALLAIALRRDDNASNAIIHGDQWDTLDFGDVERSLASTITEELMQELLLQCISATPRRKS